MKPSTSFHFRANTLSKAGVLQLTLWTSPFQTWTRTPSICATPSVQSIFTVSASAAFPSTCRHRDHVISTWFPPFSTQHILLPVSSIFHLHPIHPHLGLPVGPGAGLARPIGMLWKGVCSQVCPGTRAANFRPGWMRWPTEWRWKTDKKGGNCTLAD